MATHPNSRFALVAFLLMGSFVAFVLRSYYLQVVIAEEHLELGDWSNVSEQEVEAPRGTIVDRDGHELASSVHAPTLVFDPSFFFRHEAEHTPELLEIVGGLEDFDSVIFAEWSAQPSADLPQYYRLERRMSPARAAEILDALDEVGIRSVYAVPEYRRVYPHRELAGHIVGFSVPDGRTGVSGIERAFDEQLRGGSVSYPIYRDSDRRAYLFDELPDVDAARGNTIELTLHRPLQTFVEDALADTIAEFEAESGTVIVSVPQTGEILAMASWPPFDPNHGSRAENGYANPAVAHVFEPGSTAKIFTLAAAFDAGVIGWDTMIDCEFGRAVIGGYTIRDTHHDGEIPAWQVLQVSSNIGAYKIGRMMSQTQHRDYLLAFGFGSRPGTGLNGETPGYIPPTRWPEVGHATISFGHGFNLSPLQLNMATAAVANGGELMQPLLVRQVRAATGEVLQHFGPEVRGRAVSEAAAELTTRAMITVTEEDGTGSRAVVPGYLVAGKTGTAELVNPETGRYEEEYLASFTGFVPADDPAFAITVMIQRPNKEIAYYGGLVAAPLFREVAAQALAMHAIFPNQPVDDEDQALPDAHAEELEEASAPMVSMVGEPESVPAFQASSHALVPDFRGMWVHQAIALAAEREIRVAIHGNGRVIRQEPAALTEPSGSGYIELWLGDSEAGE